jgi:hypothetical protein
MYQIDVSFIVVYGSGECNLARGHAYPQKYALRAAVAVAKGCFWLQGSPESWRACMQQCSRL